MTITVELSRPTVVEALNKVMADVQAVGKNGRNTQQNYSFRGIDAVVNAVGPALREHGVVVVPLVEDVTYNTVEVGAKRTPMRECTVKVRYVFHGPGGDQIECVVIGEAMDSGDKATPKAMSVAFRVALLQALAIPTDEADPDSQSYERAPAPVARHWDPVDQAVERDGWEDMIRTAKDLDELKSTGALIAKARDAGQLSPATVDHLSQSYATRRAELNPAEEVKTDEPN